jgi:hypothetical protein
MEPKESLLCSEEAATKHCFELNEAISRPHPIYHHRRRRRLRQFKAEAFRLVPAQLSFPFLRVF